MKMEKKFKLLPPTMPNFISYETPVKRRQDGSTWNVGLNVSDLKREEAEEYGELMKQTFIKHWESKSGMAITR
jgi:hypothetical protein